MTDLPQELTDQILNMMTIKDALSLRRVSTKLRPMVTKNVQDCCKCIYFHSSPLALSRLNDIYNIESLAYNVTRFVFLGAKDHRYRLNSSSNSAEFDHLDNHPWPHFFTSPRTTIPSERLRVGKLCTNEKTAFSDISFSRIGYIRQRLPVELARYPHNATYGLAGMHLTGISTITDLSNPGWFSFCHNLILESRGLERLSLDIDPNDNFT